MLPLDEDGSGGGAAAKITQTTLDGLRTKIITVIRDALPILIYIVLTFAILLFVHEAGHVIVGTLFGFKVLSFGYIQLTGLIGGFYIVLSTTNVMTVFAGGLFQALFVMFILLKTRISSLIIPVFLSLGYGVLEVIYITYDVQVLGIMLVIELLSIATFSYITGLRFANRGV